MALSQTDVINGIFSLIFVIVTVVIGLIMVFKYRVHKQKNLLLMGLAWLGLSEPWWPSTISFLIALINGVGLLNYPEIYFIVGNIFLPIAAILYTIAMTELKYESIKTHLRLIVIFIGITFYLIFFYYLFTDPSQIGELKTPVDVEYELFIILFFITYIIFILILGIGFALESLKSDNREIKLKGKFLLIAFLLFGVGAGLDSIITYPITRLILVASSIFFYCGFMLPRWIKELFIKQE